MNTVCRYIWVEWHHREIKVNFGNWRKVSDHETYEVLERFSAVNKVELAWFMNEFIGQSYPQQQEFSLGDLGVSFHRNVTSNLRASIASLSAKEGKDN